MPRQHPGIPAVPSSAGSIGPILQALKQSVERLNGSRGNRIAPLNSTATLDDVISKVNEIIDRIGP